MKKLLLLFAVGLTTALSAQSIPSYVPTDSLVGWWPFNGNANDESGNGNNGTLNGPVLTANRFGISNSAYRFQGGSHIIGSSVGFPSGNSPRTISIWYNGDSLGQAFTGVCGKQLFGYGGTTCGDNFIINFDNCDIGSNSLGKVEIQGHCLAFRNYVDQPFPNSQSWHHLVVTYSNSSINFYINGQKAGTFQNIQLNTGQNASSKFIFGAEVNQNGNAIYVDPQWPAFNGKIDDIGLWSRALDSAEIHNLYYSTSQCSVFDTVLLSVTDTLIIDVNFIGFNPVQFEHSVKAYPNPAKDHLVMDIPSAMTTQGYSIDIKNAAGQSVFQSQLNQAQLQIDLTTWGNGGLYFLHLLDSSGSMVDVKKIILQ